LADVIVCQPAVLPSWCTVTYTNHGNIDLASTCHSRENGNPGFLEKHDELGDRDLAPPIEVDEENH
jgi:hypothetical protein